MNSRRLAANARYEKEERTGLFCMKAAFSFSLLFSLVVIALVFASKKFSFFEGVSENLCCLKNPLIFFAALDFIVLMLFFCKRPPFQFAAVKMFVSAGFFAYLSFSLFEGNLPWMLALFAFCSGGFLSLRMPRFLSGFFFASFACGVSAWLIIIF